jgi:hypothetical protein
LLLVSQIGQKKCLTYDTLNLSYFCAPRCLLFYKL